MKIASFVGLTKYSYLLFYFKNIVDFAKSVSTEDVSNSEASSAFWAEITGDHEDQIYIHVGRLVDGKFDLAGPNN